MSRSGFALFTVLWVLTALTALTGTGLIVARLGHETTRNRLLLGRGEWARDACAEILQARAAANPAVRQTGTIDLGRGTWCRASLEDPGAKLNVNTSDRDVLARLFRRSGIAVALAESVWTTARRGPIHDLRQVPGMDSSVADRLAPFVTTRGTGAVNIDVAPMEVLLLLPGMSDEAALMLITRREARPVASADELAGLLSPSSRAVLLNSYPEFVRATVFEPQQLIATVEGGVRGTPIVARATIIMVPTAGRLAVVRRETE